MNNVDFILIAQSEIFNYEEYSNLPLDRIELCKELVYPRMVYYKNGFHSHLDIINKIKDGVFYSEADYNQKRKLLNIWNLPSSNGIHISDYLNQHNINTAVINNFDSEWDRFCNVYESCDVKPIVGISTTFYLSYSPIKKIISKLRKNFSDIEIVVGGAFINEQSINSGIANFEAQMRKHKINYILHSFNSETDLKDLIISKKNNSDLTNVYNLCYIDGDIKSGKFTQTTQKWNTPILETENKSLNNALLPFINHTIQVRTSSGCPYSCTFCSYPKVAGKFITMTMDNVSRMINNVSNINGVNKIIFIDDTFNAKPSQFKDICKLLLNYNFEWFAFLRVNTIDENTVKLMKDSGCRGVFLGLESANENVLINMNKKATIAQYTNGINLLKNYDILTVGSFIIGFPGDTEETINNNINFINNSGLDFFKLEEFYYLHHTPIYNSREKYKLTGEGNNWEHETMDYKTASILKLKMFKEIKNSIYIDSDTSLWSIAYMYDQGYSIDIIKNIQKEINKIVLDQINGIYNDNHSSFNNIKTIVTNI